jgi:inner membrane protein
MFIAHLPAGYVLTRRLIDRAPAGDALSRRLLALGLWASVLPNLDLLYFYLIDNRQTLHHLYWPHVPVFWLAPAALSLLFCAITRNRTLTLVSLVFYANIFLHLVLDTVAGHISWLYPFYPASFVLIEVPARYGWWVWNFVLHWTFGLELLICAWAVAIFARSKRKRRSIGQTAN